MAGMAIEDYLGSGPNMSALAQNEHMRDAKETITGYRTEAEVGAAGLANVAKTAATEAILDARADYNMAQQQASNMSQIGGMLGQGISGLGSLFGRRGGNGAGGFGSFSTGIGSDVSGFSVDDYQTMGGTYGDGLNLSRGGSRYWEYG